MSLSAAKTPQDVPTTGSQVSLNSPLDPLIPVQDRLTEASGRPLNGDFNAGNSAPRLVSKDPMTGIRMNYKNAKFVPVSRFSNNPANSCMLRWIAVMVSPPGLSGFYAT